MRARVHQNLSNAEFVYLECCYINTLTLANLFRIL
jgi:hypothetical protein